MDTSKFQAARLIPITGINGDLERERRTTSAFLAVMQAVPEFAFAILGNMGAPKGRISCFIEPEFVLDGKKLRPDGLIVVEKGSKTWTTLVEVKTNTNPLKLDQIHAYLDIARLNGIDSLLTISNEVLTLTGLHPTPGIDGRKLKKTNLTHFSWIRLLTEALVQEKFRGISDPDQAWILRELIRYLQDDSSGALSFTDMGSGWVSLRDAAAQGTLSAKTPFVSETIANFESLLRYASFRISAKLGVQASEVAPKLAKLDPKKHQINELQKFVSSSVLEGAIAVPKTVSNINISVDLKAGLVRCFVDVQAPREGREQTKVNWLLKQLAPKAGEQVRVESYAKRSSVAIGAVIVNESAVDSTVLVPGPGKEISFFRLSVTSKMGSKRAGEDSKAFVGSVVQTIESCYHLTLERLKAWAPKAPKLMDAGVSHSPFEPEGGDLGVAEVAQVLEEAPNDSSDLLDA